MSSGPSTDDGNRKLLIEQCIEGGLIKEKESGEFSEAADPRSKFQKLMRISAREEMAMTENAQLRLAMDRLERELTTLAVSYTHLTLPTKA